MKFRVGVATGAALLGLLGAAPTAHADESMYLQQVREPNKLFISVTNRQLLTLGYAACDAMRSAIKGGMSMAHARAQADQTVARTAHSMGLESDRASNMNITQEAEHNLC